MVHLAWLCVTGLSCGSSGLVVCDRSELWFIWLVEAPWLGGRMPDSGAREPMFESSMLAPLWRQQSKILVIVLGNKL